jgi:hypothetical protein
LTYCHRGQRRRDWVKRYSIAARGRLTTRSSPAIIQRSTDLR